MTRRILDDNVKQQTGTRHRYLFVLPLTVRKAFNPDSLWFHPISRWVGDCIAWFQWRAIQVFDLGCFY